MIFIVDSWAWIEYFVGSKGGLKLKKFIDNKNHKFITMECTLSEVKSYCMRTNSDFGRIKDIIKKNSIMLPVSIDIWLKAAEAKHEIRKKVKDFGLIGAILVAKQNELNCMLISGDEHFKNMKKIVYIGD